MKNEYEACGLLERGYRAALCEREAENDETRVES